MSIHVISHWATWAFSSRVRARVEVNWVQIWVRAPVQARAHHSLRYLARPGTGGRDRADPEGSELEFQWDLQHRPVGKSIESAEVRSRS